MKFFIFLIAVGFLFSCSKNSEHATQLTQNPAPEDSFTVADCQQCVVITEQAEPAIAIIDVKKQKSVWEWSPKEAQDLENPEWFSHPDEAKAVYDQQYVLITASGGGVGLVRIKDKKVVFQAYAGGNPHSAEILPDGNMVSASSTGNFLTIFHPDSTKKADQLYKKQVYVPFGHNVVWDKKREVLWSAGKNKLYSYQYNFNCQQPDLQLQDSLQLPGDDAHDLFPVYDSDSLWLTNTTGVYSIDLKNKKITPAESDSQEDVKSISSGPASFPTILAHPKEQWWTDEVLDVHGNSIFSEAGLKIYKVRWWLPNLFSYPENDAFRQCK